MPKYPKTVEQVSVAGKTVLLRVDFNVSLAADGHISDSTRIEAALETIRYLLGHEAKVILISHLGRPKGAVDPKLSLKVVAQKLASLLGQPVVFVPACIGEMVAKAKKTLRNGEVLMLENVRFYPEETQNSQSFAQELAHGIEVYINDAFGAIHREHASISSVPKYVPETACGFLVEKELNYLQKRLENPARPFVIVLGGAKVSSKLGVLEALLTQADTLLIGGAMAFTFLKAFGHTVGNSLVEEDYIDFCKALFSKAQKAGKTILLPVDFLAAKAVDWKTRTLVEPSYFEGSVHAGFCGVDIGPKTEEAFTQAIRNAQTVFWNGPMGIYEIEKSFKGTASVAQAIAEAEALTIVGGGDSIDALNKSGKADAVDFISTGGGASLALLEGKMLPGIQALIKVG